MSPPDDDPWQRLAARLAAVDERHGATTVTINRNAYPGKPNPWQVEIEVGRQDVLATRPGAYDEGYGEDDDLTRAINLALADLERGT